MKEADWEKWLGHALASEAEPEEKLNQSIINQLMERRNMKNTKRKMFSAGLLAAVLLLALSVSVYAATQLFSAREVVEQLGYQLLADAFESEDAVSIDQSASSGDYRFTLHGLVSGAGLSTFKDASVDIYPDRTYAVVSIAREDGQPMPDTADPRYGQDPFFISPLIKGVKPWTVNIASMNGGYSETVIDGVMYRMIELDYVDIFADRGVYLAISSGKVFYSNEAFHYDEVTGEIRARDDYPGAAVLFDLPLDPSKTDHNKAEAYLESLLNPVSQKQQDSQTNPALTEHQKAIAMMHRVRAKLLNGETIGETIPDSVKEVTYDSSGNFTYTHDDWTITTSVGEWFREGQSGYSHQFSISGDGDRYLVLLFDKDDDGVITGRIIILDNALIPE
ncbi:hypothetical protein M6D81_05990 [Paenibacillus sp. J5C_2022]|uniref:hypothetical protein n=1 Tax=Paenibacillus sp. J5C2022 TaxID=2977129 RepID=UPI0021D0E9B3|nr:hypothetical protein [Paenibacillus sp. J5C2022]MCU6708259.1 hypothetical protein [Paenibacillus sp. J5C2022]